MVNLAAISKSTGGTFIYVEVGRSDCHSGMKFFMLGITSGTFDVTPAPPPSILQ